jgi:hypothetical protein
MNKLLASVIIIIGLQSCSDSDKLEHGDLIIGSWTIFEATKDGISYDYWNGLKIVIKQTDLNKGTYSVIDTPSESIWRSSGTWQKLDIPNAINFDNSVDANYSIDEDNLKFSFLIVDDMLECTEPPCILIVYGQWFFNTRKD